MKTIKTLLFIPFLLLVIITQVAAENTKGQVTKVNRRTSKPAPEPLLQSVAPDALLRELYQVHARPDGQILDRKSRRLLDKYFDTNLANLIWQDLTRHRDDYGVIDFDIFYNTQDPDIKKLVVGRPRTTGTKALVPVTFTNSGTRETVRYILIKQRGSWKISDIEYRNGETLLQYFREGA